jgi:hypothetical protein
VYFKRLPYIATREVAMSNFESFIKASTFKSSSPNSFSKQYYAFSKARWARNVVSKLKFNQYWG